MNIDNSTPVVVLNLQTHGSLGIVRTLGRMGVPVYGIHAHLRVPTLASRYCRGAFCWDLCTAEPLESVAFLNDVARRIGRRSILIPTADEGAVFVQEHAEALCERFLFPKPGVPLVKSLASKKEMYFLARAHGVDTAETVFPQSRLEVHEFAAHAVFPVMLKAIDGNLLKRRAGVKMVIVRDARELLEKYDALEDPRVPNLMLQEFIPGGAESIWMFNGYFDASSECLLAFTGKKLRQNPVNTGMTSLGICLANDHVRETTIRFMRDLGYRGILDIGYRYDARNGRYKLLDANPRCGATFRLFTGTQGMDVVRALYLDLTGQPVPPDTQREGRKWWVEDTDLVSSFNYWRNGELTMKQWLRSLRGVQESAYLAGDDWRPFLRLVSSLPRRAWRRALKQQDGTRIDSSPAVRQASKSDAGFSRGAAGTPVGATSTK